MLYNPDLIIEEDSNKQKTIEDKEENILCSFTPNMPLFVSEQQNDTTFIQNNNDTNSPLNTPILENNSIDNFSEDEQISIIIDDNEKTLSANEISSSHTDLIERNSHSIAGDISRTFDTEDNDELHSSFNDSVSSQSSDMIQENSESNLNQQNTPLKDICRKLISDIYRFDKSLSFSF